jgi:hypothetical protein
MAEEQLRTFSQSFIMQASKRHLLFTHTGMSLRDLIKRDGRKLTKIHALWYNLDQTNIEATYKK